MIARVSKALNKKDGEKGFTLIELLVVVIIIGILAAIAIPVFLNQRKSAIDASVKSDLRTVANELETWFTENQTYPADTTASTAASGQVTLGTGTTAKTIPVSSGNVITITTATGANVAAGTYRITGYNANGSATAADPIVYDSDAGGLQD